MDSPVIAKIKTRGYWRVSIRPDSFEKDRVKTLGTLETMLRGSHVELRGWDYPHIDRSDGIQRGDDWVEGSVDWNEHKEYWRFYQSTQFFHLFAMREDWWGDLTAPGVPDVKPGQLLSFESTLYTMTEIFLFASRLAEKATFTGDVVIDYHLFGLKGRELNTIGGRRAPLWGKTASLPDFGREPSFPAHQLMGHATDLALDHTLQIFDRFGWEPARETLAEEQRRFLERRI